MDPALHGRITSASSPHISLTIFEFLRYDSGSAISISSSDWTLSIDRCLFRQCISDNVGGAIKVTSKILKIIKTCFDTCFIDQPADDIWGNAIHASSNSPQSSEAHTNLTSFISCGPDTAISGDSTIYFFQFPLSANNINYTRCNSNAGAAAISIQLCSGKVSFMELIGGISPHISCVYTSLLLSYTHSNIIDWKQGFEHRMFWTNTGKTTLSSCCVFVASSWRTLGNVVFLNDCYGNIGSNVTKTDTTAFPLNRIRADDYCRFLRTDFARVQSSLVKLLLFVAAGQFHSKLK